MKHLTSLAILSLLLCNFTFAQDQGKYSELAAEAWSLYESENFGQAAEKYKEAFEQLGGKAYPDDRYNAACSYALADSVESSFYHLFYLAENPKILYSDLNQLSTDTDLEVLHTDQRWEHLLKIVTANKDEYEKYFDKALVAQLDTIYQLDQNYRNQIDEIEEKYGWESDEMKAHWKIIQEKDSLNLLKVSKILDERGWLGAEVVGNQGNSALFLVIQHADIETQEKYLPMMREAVKAGNARSSSLALLEDRVALRKGEKQIYGSQVSRDTESGEYYVLPLIDPDNVDKRRAEVGLDPIQNYISNWGMTWDVEDYKKRLPEYEAKQKQ